MRALSELCKFGGDRLHLTAKKGRCTDTAGYISNAEINEIRGLGGDAKTWYDRDSGSNIITYEGKEWAAFMTTAVKTSRTGYYKRLNFAGVVDWAVDLQSFTNDDGSPDPNDEFPQPVPQIPDCTASYTSLDDLNAAVGEIPEACKAYYTSKVLLDMLEGAV